MNSLYDKRKQRVKRVDKHGNKLQIGDRVRVTGVHPKVKDSREFKTRTILSRCVGRIFPIVGFQKDWAELHLGRIMGRRSWEETIWVEPEFMELVTPGKRSSSRRVKKAAKRAGMLK